MKIVVVNGPNLNLLGKRESDIYGAFTLDEVERNMREMAQREGVDIEFYQSNHEGEIVTLIQKMDEKGDVLIINPAAFTHTSVAIRDAIAAISVPVIEVHISNIYARESFRQTSYTASVAAGVISGFGQESYLLGLKAAVSLVRQHKSEE